MMSNMMLLVWMLVMTLVGVIGTLGTFAWLIGSAARTIGTAHIFGNRIAQIPTVDGKLEFERIKHVDENGDWLSEDKQGNPRKLKIRPRRTYIEGGKCPVGTFLPGCAINVDPAEAKLQEMEKKGEIKADENGKKKADVWGEMIWWENLRDHIGEALSPGHYAGLFSAGLEAQKPMQMPSGNEGIDKSTAMKIGGIGFILVIAIVGFFIAQNMGFI